MLSRTATPTLKLLIELYGIETIVCHLPLNWLNNLLIELYGIETD